MYKFNAIMNGYYYIIVYNGVCVDIDCFILKKIDYLNKELRSDCCCVHHMAEDCIRTALDGYSP